MHKEVQPPVLSSTESDSPSICLQSHLTEGRYVIIPTTSSKNHKRKFAIRLITDKYTKLRNLILDQPETSENGNIESPQRMTSITILKAESLWIPGLDKEPDTYVTIECEGTKIKSQLKKDTVDPEYKLRALFYRNRPHKTIKIKVYASAFPNDYLLGSVLIAGTRNAFAKRKVYELQGPPETRGIWLLHTETFSSDNLNAF
ncbi:calpain-5-like [Protopterus annectens]|uniref:calpain-5-like n=1 Tax=Protopterus annectens TaxID=7888 RepID=UPI001CF9720E|nr:calpain-5-like [Protopterus annectens]